MNELLNASLHKNSKIISEIYLPKDSISGFLEDSLPAEFLVNFFQCPTLIFPRAMLISLCQIMEWKSVNHLKFINHCHTKGAFKYFKKEDLKNDITTIFIVSFHCARIVLNADHNCRNTSLHFHLYLFFKEVKHQTLV